MTCNQEQLDYIRAENLRHYSAREDLANPLRQVLNSPEYNLLCNTSKAEVLLDLENGGEYDPLA